MSLAVVVISHDKRKDKLDEVYRSIAWQHPDELIFTADSPRPEAWPKPDENEQWWVTGSVTHTTSDALPKRDAGYSLTKSDAVCFLSDDHLLSPRFVETYRTVYEPRDEWDFLVPARYCWRGDEQVWLNVGKHHNYAGGHCAIYRRTCATMHPFMATARHRLWDLLHSVELIGKGARMVYADKDLAVIDNEPEGQPWR